MMSRNTVQWWEKKSLWSEKNKRLHSAFSGQSSLQISANLNWKHCARTNMEWRLMGQKSLDSACSPQFYHDILKNVYFSAGKGGGGGVRVAQQSLYLHCHLGRVMQKGPGRHDTWFQVICIWNHMWKMAAVVGFSFKERFLRFQLLFPDFYHFHHVIWGMKWARKLKTKNAQNMLSWPFSHDAAHLLSLAHCKI